MTLRYLSHYIAAEAAPRASAATSYDLDFITFRARCDVCDYADAEWTSGRRDGKGNDGSRQTKSSIVSVDCPACKEAENAA